MKVEERGSFEIGICVYKLRAFGFSLTFTLMFLTYERIRLLLTGSTNLNCLCKK